ncbi:MAG TPA: zinc ribbon domain-containing protein [Vicinamibacterales bacterium]|nr:zinc ribbon domain-containing protein [Vicinamibacterales bacterium]
MSSATSTNLERDAQVRRTPDGAGDRSVPRHPDVAATAFRPAHFFVLASLIAATAAVVMSRQSSPEQLVLISLVIASAGLAAGGFYRMLSPLVTEVTAVSAEPLSERGRAALQREKLLVMRSIKELEFDRSMGKMSQADFDEMAGRLRARALLLLKQLDEDGSGYRSIIEREISTRLAATAGTPASAEPAAPATAAAATCGCGTANDPDAVFCKKCGSRLSAADPAPTPSR